MEEEGSEESDLGDEFLGEFEKLSRKDYRIDEILDDTYHDLNTIVAFLKELRSLGPQQDERLPCGRVHQANRHPGLLPHGISHRFGQLDHDHLLLLFVDGPALRCRGFLMAAAQSAPC